MLISLHELIVESEEENFLLQISDT